MSIGGGKRVVTQGCGEVLTRENHTRKESWAKITIIKTTDDESAPIFVVIIPARQPRPANPAAAPCWNRCLILAASPRHFLHRDLDPRELVLERTLQ